MATLCNKKVTHIRTISNATGYSMYTWAIACTRGKHLQRKRPPAWQPLATHAKTVLRRSIFRHRSRHFYNNFVRFVIDVQEWRVFYDESVFVIKLKLWRIWLLQWRKLFIIEVDIPNSRPRCPRVNVKWPLTCPGPTVIFSWPRVWLVSTRGHYYFVWWINGHLLLN
jgi:hypothetical protein